MNGLRPLEGLSGFHAILKPMRTTLEDDGSGGGPFQKLLFPHTVKKTDDRFGTCQHCGEYCTFGCDACFSCASAIRNDARAERIMRAERAEMRRNAKYCKWEGFEL